MNRVEGAARQIAQHLDALGTNGAVIGGIAVSARCAPRFTRDLDLASSGIEAEIVAEAEPLEVFSGVTLPVARVGHLLALKILARDDRRRPQDLVDIRSLVAVASDEEILRAKNAARLIQQRGFARGRDLRRRLAAALKDRDG